MAAAGVTVDVGTRGPFQRLIEEPLGAVTVTGARQAGGLLLQDGRAHRGRERVAVAVGGLGQGDAAVRISGLLALPEVHPGEHGLVVGFVGPLDGAAGPMLGAGKVAGVFMQPGGGFGVACGQGEQACAQCSIVGRQVEEFVDGAELITDTAQGRAGAEQVVGLDQVVPLLVEMAQEFGFIELSGQLHRCGTTMRGAERGGAVRRGVLPGAWEQPEKVAGDS